MKLRPYSAIEIRLLLLLLLLLLIITALISFEHVKRIFHQLHARE